MTIPQFVLKGETRNYPILITNLSIMVMEQETGLRLPKLFQHVGRASVAIQKKGKAKAEAIEDLAMEVGMTEILALLLAGLEGFRSKFKTRTLPYTLEEASDILTECGGIPGVQTPLAECFSAYFPSAMGVEVGESGNGTGQKKKGRKKKSKTSRRTSKSS